MTETDASREAVERHIHGPLRDAVLSEGRPRTVEDIQGRYATVGLLRALLARAEKAEAWAIKQHADADRYAARLKKAEAERDTAWNDAIEAAAQRIDQHIQKVQPEMTRRAQRLAEKKKPGFGYAIHRSDLDARISCRDQVRALRKGDTP